MADSPRGTPRDDFASDVFERRNRHRVEEAAVTVLRVIDGRRMFAPLPWP
ncbi:hypothetical protein [Sphingomonas psychrotolerans]|nr:hypothetical protein [Sphingomonas psychrotolerans]